MKKLSASGGTRTPPTSHIPQWIGRCKQHIVSPIPARAGQCIVYAPTLNHFLTVNALSGGSCVVVRQGRNAMAARMISALIACGTIESIRHEEVITEYAAGVQ